MNDVTVKNNAGGGLRAGFQVFPYILFLAGIAGIAVFVRSGSLPLERGILAAAAWILLFVLSDLSAKSAENKRMRENDKKERRASVERIQAAVRRINEKALALNASYAGEKQALADMSLSAKALLPTVNLEASKMEYEILTSLTRLDFLCDKAIAGTDRGGDFHKELESLAVKMRAREKL